MGAFEDAINLIRHAVYGEEVREGIASALELSMNTQQSVAGKEDSSNKVATVNSNSTDIEYPSAKAVYDSLDTKESKSNKIETSINPSAASTTKYPSEMAVVSYVSSSILQMANGKLSFDYQTTSISYNATNYKKVFTNAAIDTNIKGIVFTHPNSLDQVALCSDGTIRTRSPENNSYGSWEIVSEKVSNKVATVNSNSTDIEYPSAKAVHDFVRTISQSNIKYNASTTTYDPSTREGVNTIYTRVAIESGVTGVTILGNSGTEFALCSDGTIRYRTPNGSSSYTGWINLIQKATSIGESNKTSGAYPTVQAVYNFVTAFVASAISGKANTADVNTALVEKENTSDKLASGEDFSQNKTSPEKYLSALAAYQYGLEHYTSVEDMRYLQSSLANVEAYIGYADSDVLGLHADFQSKSFVRIAGAEGLTAGEDFDGFSMFGGRRRCNVADDGTINAFYGDAGYTEDGSNGQVMVYQPKFYYKVVPLKLEKQSSGLGYHIRKANYYVTATPHAGFKLHPLFYDANGNEAEYVLLSAYEGSLYDVSTGNYINDNTPGSYTYAQGDQLCSVAGKKPISGNLANVGTKANFEEMAQARGTGWHLDTIKSVSANQLLMLIELGQFNTQTAMGLGIVDNVSNGTYNCASLTGSTTELGNETGMASATIFENGSGTTINTVNGKVSVSYRGIENPWGNIYKHVNGINLWGDGTMNGGQIYIAENFSFNEASHGGNYQPAGFTYSNTNGYVSAFGYGSEKYDWLFLPTAVNENNADNTVPVGDRVYCRSNATGTYTFRFGGSWETGDAAGGFSWYGYAASGTANRARILGGRLLYVPTAVI